jgi:hypothetical protein
MPSWVTLIFTTLGAGAVGSIITTYGSQTRERRAARAQARDCLRRAVNLARTLNPLHADITAALDELDTSAMIAGLPRGLVDLHREAPYAAPGQDCHGQDLCRGPRIGGIWLGGAPG